MNRSISIAIICGIVFGVLGFALKRSSDAKIVRNAAIDETETLTVQLAEAREQIRLLDNAVAELAPKTGIVKADELLGMTSLGSFTVTHYCPCSKCCGKSDGVTASGRKVVPYYTIAVDPSVIPLGTVCYLDYGDGVLHEARADDTGGAVIGHKLDLCVGDHQTAVQYGIRTATVYVGGRK